MKNDETLQAASVMTDDELRGVTGGGDFFSEEFLSEVRKARPLAPFPGEPHGPIFPGVSFDDYPKGPFQQPR